MRAGTGPDPELAAGPQSPRGSSPTEMCPQHEPGGIAHARVTRN